jgi:hypothetical protein
MTKNASKDSYSTLNSRACVEAVRRIHQGLWTYDRKKSTSDSDAVFPFAGIALAEQQGRLSVIGSTTVDLTDSIYIVC